MKRSIVVALGMLALLSVGFFMLDDLGAGPRPNDLREERVNANLVRVKVNGQWQEFPLMPLAEHLCQGGNRLFQPYCDSL